MRSHSHSSSARYIPKKAKLGNSSPWLSPRNRKAYSLIIQLSIKMVIIPEICITQVSGIICYFAAGIRHIVFMESKDMTRRTILKIMGSAAFAAMMATTESSVLISCIEGRKKRVVLYFTGTGNCLYVEGYERHSTY